MVDLSTACPTDGPIPRYPPVLSLEFPICSHPRQIASSTSYQEFKVWCNGGSLNPSKARRWPLQQRVPMLYKMLDRGCYYCLSSWYRVAVTCFGQCITDLVHQRFCALIRGPRYIITVSLMFPVPLPFLTQWAGPPYRNVPPTVQMFRFNAAVRCIHKAAQVQGGDQTTYLDRSLGV